MSAAESVGVPGSTGSVAEEPTSGDTPARDTSITSITPSGLEIEFSWEPKRQYRLRQQYEPGDLGPEDPGTPGDWVEVPSVTDVLSVLDKSAALTWWGMRVGIEGVKTLADMQLVTARPGEGLLVNTVNGFVPATPLMLEELIVKQKLSTNHRRDEAGKRGTAVHDVLEMWAAGEPLPDVDLFPPSEQGYVVGLFRFLAAIPSAVPLASEVMVGSLEHGFAGRYDVRFRTTEKHRLVVHRTPVRGPQWADLAPGLYLGDLKTTKDRYTSHDRQLEGYEGAGVECGYEPTDGRGVLLVSPEGYYKFIRSRATYQDFLNTLAVYIDEQRLK